MQNGKDLTHQLLTLILRSFEISITLFTIGFAVQLASSLMRICSLIGSDLSVFGMTFILDLKTQQTLQNFTSSQKKIDSITESLIYKLDYYKIISLISRNQK